MKVKFLEIDKPTKNGRIYPKEVVEKALKLFMEYTKQDLFPIFEKASIQPPTMNDIVGFVKDIHIENDYLVGEVGFIEGKVEHIPNGEIINVRPNGFGSIVDGVVQNDYVINGFSIVRQQI